MTITQPSSPMLLALTLAEKGRLTVSPNPMVGCVLLKDGNLLAEGFHERPGAPHAEIHALNAAGPAAKGATAYVTLEPCCHYGRTPPCTESLIAAGIKEIHIACLDPNPLVAGKGVEALRKAGIKVLIGDGAEEARTLNEVFFHYIRNRRPFVIAKWAMSLDGKTITHPKDVPQISGEASHQDTHQLRHQVDAILVGANTARIDDPKLTARVNLARAASKQPLRIVLSTDGELMTNLKLFSEDLPGKTIIATTVKRAFPAGVESMLLPKNSDGQVDLDALLSELGQREVSSLLVEGGMKVHQSFFKSKLVNKVLVYVAPVIIADLEKKENWSTLQMKQLGQDLCLIAKR